MKVDARLVATLSSLRITVSGERDEKRALPVRASPFTEALSDLQTKSYVPPPDMTFAKSDALFPTAEVRAMLAAEFEKQCRILCFGPIPTWDEMQARLDDIRELL